MDVVLRLIEHLLSTDFSIDRVDSIVNQLKISKDHLLKLLNNDQYKDFFQSLRSSNNHSQEPEKIALTLDLFCCTHYANNCRNASCAFLHLCPYNVRPRHTKCTNKTCPYDHDVLKSVHNRRIIDARGLSFIPTRILNEITRASANPARSFWVCTDYGKKSGCSKGLYCDKLHYCYYSLTDTCTKSHCQHVIIDACLTYFRQKELSEQDHDDILEAFKKVLRQRKADYINTGTVPYQASSASSASPKMSTSENTQRKSSANRPHRPSSSSRRSTPMAGTTTTISSYDDILSSKPDCPPPVADHEQDIVLVGQHNARELQQITRYLSEEIGCPIELLISKEIISENKTNENAKVAAKPLYYYCPTKNPSDIFQLLRWQNEEKQFIKPLIVFASIRDAHDAAKQNFENDQFCLFRVHLFNPGVINGNLLPENRLQLNDSSTMCFDRMWVYIYDLS